MELSEKDKIWVENRHRHMKDTIDKLMGDFRKFIEQNPHFTDENADTTNLSAIRDMLAGLPQFQEMKEAYSLHLTMAQECMNIFQYQKLPDIASSEQTLATGLDEDYRKPKNVLDSVVRLLDDEAVTPPDRLRLIVLYALYREGVVLEDVKRLLAHASLPQPDTDVLSSLQTIGGRTIRKELKETRPPRHQLFPIDPRTAAQANEEYSLSRFEPAVKPLLDALARGVLSQDDFPYIKPPIDPNEDILVAQGGSLRAGRPNWAAAGRRPPENRQRLMVFMAGGATYSESRACYEVGVERGRDIILATSHMLTPSLYVRQLRDLCRTRQQLDLPADRPKPRAPAHLFERPAPPPAAMAPPGGRGAPGAPPPSAAGGRRPPPTGGLPSRPGGPPTQAMSSMSLNSTQNSTSRPNTGQSHTGNGATPAGRLPQEDGKLHKEKKKRNFLGMKK